MGNIRSRSSRTRTPQPPPSQPDYSEQAELQPGTADGELEGSPSVQGNELDQTTTDLATEPLSATVSSTPNSRIAQSRSSNSLLPPSSCSSSSAAARNSIATSTPHKSALDIYYEKKKQQDPIRSLFDPTRRLLQMESSDERKSLRELFDATSGRYWNSKFNWTSPAPLNTWYRVKCIQGRVLGLELNSNNLTGAMPLLYNLRYLTNLSIYDNCLEGTVSWTELCANTPAIRRFDISHNKLNGFVDWHCIAALWTDLDVFNISNNLFEGTLPTEEADIKRLMLLRVFDVSGNCLEGPISREMFYWFRQWQLNQTGDKSLSIRGNDRFWIDEHTFDRFYNLKQLVLNNSSLRGELSPTVFSPIPNIVVLDLSWNALTGTFPFSIIYLKKLQVINLSHNSFQGAIPTELGSLTYLTTVNLSFNGFTGHIPQSFENLRQLASLELGLNRLSGPIPYMAHFRRFEDFSTSGNDFEGTVYQQITQMNGWKNYRAHQRSIWERRKWLVLAMVSTLRLHGYIDDLSSTEIQQQQPKEDEDSMRESTPSASFFRTSLGSRQSASNRPSLPNSSSYSPMTNCSTGRLSSSGAAAVAVAGGADAVTSSSRNSLFSWLKSKQANSSTHPGKQTDAAVAGESELQQHRELNAVDEAVLMSRTKHLVGVFGMEYLCVLIASYI